MIIEADGIEAEAEIATDHATSIYGRPVLLVHGAPVSVGNAREARLLIVVASEDEREALARGGYSLPDARHARPDVL